ncbi:carbohydrate ABC transporter permease [Paenibacillus sp. FSL H8-0034]|uniref:carbohydrate ABC transporter permease n=1 Tax=Paenibacillus sp. FSL H8-0034 TaxID=2954671 RepID=UPI0030F6A51C
MKKESSFSKRELFPYVNGLVLTVFGLLCLLPFLHVISKSVSEETAVTAGKVGLFPVGIQWDTFYFVIVKSGFLSAFRNSLFITIVGTILALLVTVMAAYPLSKPGFKGAKAILMLYVFTMLFSGGIIPGYVLMKSLGLLDSLWSLILPGIIVPFNMLVMKTFFEGIPESLEESAKIDGASYMRILFEIVLPISMPVIATIGLFYGVGYWNSFFNAMIYINSQDLKPLQLFLYEMIVNSDTNLKEMSSDEMMNITSEGVKAATIVVSALPIMVVYPFLQKYFVKGLTLGSVKG